MRALSHGGRTVSEAVRPTDLSQAGESREVGVDAASVTPPSQAVMKCPGCCDHRETLTSGEGARLAREDVSFLSPGTCLCSCRRGFREMARAPGPGDAIRRPAGAELARWSLCRVRGDVTSAGPPPAWPHAGAGPARSAHPRPAVRSTSLMTRRLGSQTPESRWETRASHAWRLPPPRFSCPPRPPLQPSGWAELPFLSPAPPCRLAAQCGPENARKAVCAKADGRRSARPRGAPRSDAGGSGPGDPGSRLSALSESPLRCRTRVHHRGARGTGRRRKPTTSRRR